MGHGKGVNQSHATDRGNINVDRVVEVKGDVGDREVGIDDQKVDLNVQRVDPKDLKVAQDDLEVIQNDLIADQGATPKDREVDQIVDLALIGESILTAEADHAVYHTNATTVTAIGDVKIPEMKDIRDHVVDLTVRADIAEIKEAHVTVAEIRAHHLILAVI